MTTKEQILKCFKDINHAYNDCTRYDTLKHMLDELQEPCEDAISRKAVLNVVEKAVTKEVARWSIKELPPVKPQIICPIHGVYCEDCSAYEKKLNKWIGAEVLDEIKNEITMLHIFNRKNVIEIIDKYKAESEGKNV